MRETRHGSYNSVAENHNDAAEAQQHLAPHHDVLLYFNTRDL